MRGSPTFTITSASAIISDRRPPNNFGTKLASAVYRSSSFISATVVSTLLCLTHANAQTSKYEIVPEDARMTDSNGIDMTSGLANFSVDDVKIGGVDPLQNIVQSFNYPNPYATSPGPDTGKTNGFYVSGGAANTIPQFKTNFRGGMGVYSGSGGNVEFSYNGSWVSWNIFTFAFDGHAETFLTHQQYGSPWSETAPTGYSFTSATKRGGQMVYLGSGAYKFISRNGDEYWMDSSRQLYIEFSQTTWPVFRKRAANGKVTKYNYTGNDLVSVERSDGFSVRYVYDANNKIVGARATNLAVARCGPIDKTCLPTGVWPTSSYQFSNNGRTFTVTDASGASDIFYMDQYDRVVQRKERHVTNSYNVEYQYCKRESPVDCFWQIGTYLTNFPDKTIRVVKDGLTYNYMLTPNINGGQFSLYERKDQNLFRKHSTFKNNGPAIKGRVTNVELPDGSSVILLGDITNRVTQHRKDGLRASYQYDDRGNVVVKTIAPDPTNAAAQPASLVQEAGFDLSCVIAVKCNKPNWIKDAKGAITDITYDPVHGGVLTETAPADANGIRAQRRFEYVQRYPWTLNLANNAYEAAEEPVWVLLRERMCKSSATAANSCAAGSGDEVITEYDYGPNGGPNNLLVRGVAVTADGQTLRTCFSYDRQGNKISETQPNANLGACS